jgi:hypothetical protein
LGCWNFKLGERRYAVEIYKVKEEQIALCVYEHNGTKRMVSSRFVVSGLIAEYFTSQAAAREVLRALSA